jgi:D-sedoheptulose 7-phosphate isomerase
MSHVENYLRETVEIIAQLPVDDIEKMARALKYVGKLYVIGMGGSLANAIHMAADLRKLCDIDAEAFDNIADLTARANDEGLDTIFEDWLKRAQGHDGLMVLSVGGGTPTVSRAIHKAVHSFRGVVYGIVGPDGNSTVLKASHCIRIPAPAARITPHTEAFQAIIWHCLVSHPLLQKRPTKW